MDAKLAADKKQRNEQSPIEKGLQKMDEKTLQNMDKLFQTAFYLAWKERPFTDFPDLLDLQTLRLRSGIPFGFVGAGKECLIQLLEYSSVASPQSGLFSDWSRNKRVLRTKPFALHFAHKTLKYEQVECIRRIVCHGRDVLAVLPTGFGKSAIHLSVDSKVLFNLGHTANTISKTTVTVVSPLDYIRKQQVASIEKMDCGICAAAIGESIQGDSKIENGKFDIMFGSAQQWLSDHWRKALQFAALHQTKVLVVDEVRTVATW